MTLFQHQFSRQPEAVEPGSAQSLITPNQQSAPRPLTAAEVAAVAGGPATQNDG